MGEKIKAKEVQYNHINIKDKDKVKAILLGVDKDLDEDSFSMLGDFTLELYDGLTQHIFQLEDLRDRQVLFDAIKEFKEKRKEDFHGIYWEILLDYLYSDKETNLYQLSIKLSRLIRGKRFEKTLRSHNLIKSLGDRLDKLKKSEGNPQDETLKLVELVCYYMGITKEIVKTGQGTRYTIEDDSGYTLKEIYKYCEEKWNQKQEINLKDMIREITGVGVGEIREIPVKIWVEDYLVDDTLEKFIPILIEQMNKK